MATKTSFTILLPVASRPVKELTDLCDDIEAGIGGNPTKFVTPSPTLEALRAAKDAVISANVAENLVNDASRIVLRQRKRELLDLLREIAAYVIGVAKSDRYVAELSGCKLSKEETTPQPTGEFRIRDIKPGSNDGEAVLRLADKGGYAMFIVERKTTEGEWVQIGAFQLKTYTIKGLPSGSSVIRITGYKSDVAGHSVETVVKAV